MIFLLSLFTLFTTLEAHPFTTSLDYEMPYDTKYNIQNVEDFLETADALFDLGEYEPALHYYNIVCFSICPIFSELDFRTRYMPELDQFVLYDAMKGRLECLDRLFQFESHHLYELEMLEKLDPRMIKIDEVSDSKFIVKNIMADDFHIIQKELSRHGMKYEVLPTGDMLVHIDVPCCDSCAEGNECESVKKN